jgi:sortase (surface protein transpeptidase)
MLTKLKYLVFSLVVSVVFFCIIQINHGQPTTAELLPTQETTIPTLTTVVIETQTEPEATTEAVETQPMETQPDPIPDVTEPIPTETEPRYSNYYGRLVIPDAAISVGLYHGADQAITDREDSANLFSMRVFDGLYIADHSNQEFSKLFNVTVGMRGYIRTADGTVFNIVCTDIFNGHNNGKIIDEEGNTNFDAHFLMYTCKGYGTSILICLWKHC